MEAVTTRCRGGFASVGGTSVTTTTTMCRPSPVIVNFPDEQGFVRAPGAPNDEPRAGQGLRQMGLQDVGVAPANVPGTLVRQLHRDTEDRARKPGHSVTVYSVRRR
ncbi:MAG: hypothetical protein HS107_09720 [Thermoflexaceae bacterium]|nr:hypothetical protein [Thermoflexaceae bacterium]